jgi:hypothetical protein
LRSPVAWIELNCALEIRQRLSGSAAAHEQRAFIVVRGGTSGAFFQGTLEVLPDVGPYTSTASAPLVEQPRVEHALLRARRTESHASLCLEHGSPDVTAREQQLGDFEVLLCQKLVLSLCPGRLMRGARLTRGPRARWRERDLGSGVFGVA